MRLIFVLLLGLAPLVADAECAQAPLTTPPPGDGLCLPAPTWCPGGGPVVTCIPNDARQIFITVTHP